jgi:hypothetical protein
VVLEDAGDRDGLRGAALRERKQKDRGEESDHCGTDDTEREMQRLKGHHDSSDYGGCARMEQHRRLDFPGR